MRNRYLERFDEMIKIRIRGRDVNHYLKRVIKRKVQLLKVMPVSKEEVIVILKVSEYKKLLQYKSIYEITVLQLLGRLGVKEKFKRNFILLLFLVIGCVWLFILSNVIFRVEVIHQDRDIRNLIIGELKKYNVRSFSFKKSYEELERIEDEILENNKKTLEWLEVNTYGTKYVVRVEERKLTEEEEEYQYQSIVSKKNAVIVEIFANSGEKVKKVNDYVKKGDTIISGYVTLADNSKILTKADGQVLGEVWYSIDISYPFVYQESILTGRSKTVYALYFFNERFGLFDFEEYRSFQSKDKVLVASNLLNIRFIKEKQYEMIVKDEVYTEDVVRNKAVQYIKEKLMQDNSSIKEITEVKILNSSSDERGVRFKMFVRAIEDIGEIALIEEVEEIEEGDE